MFRYTLVIISFCITLLTTSNQKFISIHSLPIKQVYDIQPLIKYDFTKLRDTIYTLSNYIIEVNLATQQVKLRSKDGWVKDFPVSSGTDKVEDGIKTNEGLFAIHSKSPKLYSVQFDSTVMLNWMGFNFGIGFHALEGKGYYKYLGKKNVSHGCLRISREDAIDIYKMIEIGTPVFVHSGSSAIYVEFGKSNTVYKYYSYKELKEIIPERLNKLYRGDYLIADNCKLLIDEKNIDHTGIELGTSEKIPNKQLIKPAALYCDINLPEIKRLEKLFNQDYKSGINYTYNAHLDSLQTVK